MQWNWGNRPRIKNTYKAGYEYMSNNSGDLFSEIVGLIGAGVRALLGKQSEEDKKISFGDLVKTAERGVEEFSDSYQDAREKAEERAERDLKKKSSAELQRLYEKNQGNQIAERLIRNEMDNRGDSPN